MKIAHLLAPLLVAPALALHAQTLTGDKLNIGTSNTPQSKSATIGNNNLINSTSANFNLLNGDSNAIYAGGTNFLTGYANWIGVASDASAMFGAYNGLDNVLATVVIGWSNHVINANSGLTVGYNNYATGSLQNLIGMGLIGGTLDTASDTCTVVIGAYNTAKADQRLIVGAGADANHRKNALEVSKAGKITMLKQGDILMGEFGNNGD